MRFPLHVLTSALLGRFAAFLIVALFLSVTSYGQISIGTGVAPVTVPSGGFNIDGTLKANGAPGDWLDGTGSGGFVLDGSGNPVNAGTTYHLLDAVGTTDNVFVGGLKKNGNPNSWGWKIAGASPSKCNINNALIHVSKASNGDTWITLSGDRESVNGNSFISLSLHQNSLTLGATSFVSAASAATGGRTPGDVQVSAEFTGGGSNPNLYLEEWKLVGSAYAWAPITIPAGKIVAYGKTNAATITGMPYNVFGGTSYQVNSFIEVSFNITDIYKSSSTPCVGSIKSMLLLTKSSQSETADLSDFVTPLSINLDISVGVPTANGANYCVGQTINALSVTGVTGATFKWYTAVDGNGKPTGSSTSGASYTTGINNAVAGTYNYYVTQSLDGCESSPKTVTVTVAALPVAYTLSGNSICSSDGNVGVLTLSNSQSGVSYQLKKSSDNSNNGPAKTGTGSAIEWTGITPGVSYYVEATGAVPTSCKSTTGPASVTGGASPTVYTLSGNSICSSAPNTGIITLSNSQSGVSYQLKKVSDNSTVQSAKAGTDAALQWTGVAAATNYFVEATGAAPTNCKSVTGNASVTEVPNPVVYTLSGNSICSGDANTGVITLSNSQTGVSYQLKKASDNSNVQSSQSGTNGNAINWTGLPASVSYYVEASAGAPTSCKSTTGNASVGVTTNPAQPTVNIVNPTCSNANGTITVVSPVGSAFEYSYNDGAFTSSAGPYNFTGGSGYKIEVKNTSSGCISVPQECSAQVIASASMLTETKAVIPGGKTKVLAAPNPFNDRVRFTMESGVSGQGSLEIFNTLGQRISVIYQGYIEAGRSVVKEFTVPTIQRNMLVYVFSVGKERVTGKLISAR
jgi:hypothetical protein